MDRWTRSVNRTTRFIDSNKQPRRPNPENTRREPVSLRHPNSHAKNCDLSRFPHSTSFSFSIFFSLSALKFRKPPVIQTVNNDQELSSLCRSGTLWAQGFLWFFLSVTYSSAAFQVYNINFSINNHYIWVFSSIMCLSSSDFLYFFRIDIIGGGDPWFNRDIQNARAIESLKTVVVFPMQRGEQDGITGREKSTTSV